MGDDGEWFDYEQDNTDWSEYGGGESVDGDGVDWGKLGGQFLPVASSANGGYRPGVTPTMGAFPGAATAGAALVSLGARLAGMFGRGAGTFVLNGVKGSMSRLWPYINKYGPMAVASALGISVAQLGALAMNAPRHGRKRRRGISARDIATTRRTYRTVSRMARQIGFGRGGGRSRRYGGGRRPRYYPGHYH